MYTPEFLVSKAPDLPSDAAKMLQPYVANLAVSAAARKQGVGSALMRACEQVCTALPSPSCEQVPPPPHPPGPVTGRTGA